MKRIMERSWSGLSFAKLLPLFSFGLALLLLAGVSYAESPAALAHKWSLTGSGDGYPGKPMDVAVDSKGNVYVADHVNNCIQKFAGSGAFVTKWGSTGTGDGQFQNPCSVDVDSAGNVYVADTGNHRIQKFTSQGSFIAKWGAHGAKDGELNNPEGVVVDPAGILYVIDSNNWRIQKFTNKGDFMAMGTWATGAKEESSSH